VRKERGEEGEAASGPQRGRESSLFGGRTAEIEDVDTPRTCGQAKCVKETHRSGVRKRSKGRAREGAGEGTGREEIWRGGGICQNRHAMKAWYRNTDGGTWRREVMELLS